MLAREGTEAHAQTLREEIAGVLSTMGLRLSPEKTLITHVDEGLVFLGWRIQRHQKRGTGKRYVYVYPAKKALAAVMAKVKTICRRSMNLSLEDLLRQLNRMLRGWTAYFKYGCSNATFSYLRAYLWKEIIRWQERKRCARAGSERLRRGGRPHHRGLPKPRKPHRSGHWVAQCLTGHGRSDEFSRPGKSHHRCRQHRRSTWLSC
ncbi:group II intron maturase-specific domain-containing protein [Streptomyces sp. NBC_00057]|uniref:group II intron maturase-specific domain-containing protein n=1 Tax=Streptomyces sp. NBC_00057 TaxID=2975634 RepID=UPI00324C09FE